MKRVVEVLETETGMGDGNQAKAIGLAILVLAENLTGPGMGLR